MKLMRIVRDLGKSGICSRYRKIAGAVFVLVVIGCTSKEPTQSARVRESQPEIDRRNTPPISVNDAGVLKTAQENLKIFDSGVPESSPRELLLHRFVPVDIDDWERKSAFKGIKQLLTKEERGCLGAWVLTASLAKTRPFKKMFSKKEIESRGKHMKRYLFNGEDVTIEQAILEAREKKGFCFSPNEYKD